MHNLWGPGLDSPSHVPALEAAQRRGGEAEEPHAVAWRWFSAGADYAGSTISPLMIPFDFKGQAVRVVSVEGKPRFVLADVCRVLEIGNPSDAARRLDDDERGVDTIDTLGC